MTEELFACLRIDCLQVHTHLSSQFYSTVKPVITHVMSLLGAANSVYMPCTFFWPRSTPQFQGSVSRFCPTGKFLSRDDPPVPQPRQQFCCSFILFQGKILKART